MAWTGSGADTESVFRHPLNAMTRLSQRTPLRVKLITALLALVALALTVISFISIAVFSGYLENQVDTNLAHYIARANSRPLNAAAAGTVRRRRLCLRAVRRAGQRDTQQLQSARQRVAAPGNRGRLLAELARAAHR